jgi:hypothetical protein
MSLLDTIHKTNLPEKYRLELKHPRDGEEHGRIIRHERGAGEDLVAACSIEIEETPANRIPAPLP